MTLSSEFSGVEEEKSKKIKSSVNFYFSLDHVATVAKKRVILMEPFDSAVRMIVCGFGGALICFALPVFVSGEPLWCLLLNPLSSNCRGEPG